MLSRCYKMSSIFIWLLLVTLNQNVLSNETVTMPQKKIVPTITTSEDLEKNLNGYLREGDKLALLLDYDGTLAPIAPHPDLTAMPNDTETILRTLSRHPNIFVAVISGRSLADVKKKVGIQHIAYGGNHGIEIENPDGTRSDYELPDEIQANHMKIVNELKKLEENNAWVEDKKVSLTYHYRDTPTELIEAQRAEAVRIIESHSFKANQAHFAIEAKPPVNWHKGEAAKFILQKHFGDNWRTSTKAIFAGDDTTDEDAMKALQGSGKSFRISENPTTETYADYRFPTTKQITILLKWIEDQYN